MVLEMWDTTARILENMNEYEDRLKCQRSTHSDGFQIEDIIKARKLVKRKNVILNHSLQAIKI